MRVLLTGATGFIGTALCERLCREGHEVAAFHRKTSYIGRISKLPLTRLTGDLTDEGSVEQAVSTFRPEVIYHLGAQMTAAPTVSRIMQVNVLGTRYVLLSALKNRTERVILMSSACTLGMPELFHKYNQQPVVMNEARVRNAEFPLWPFAESKYFAEMEAQSALTGGLDVVIVNPFLVIGPGDWYRRKSSVLIQLKEHPPVVVPKGGLNVIPIEDMVSGLLNACRYGKSGERYLLCGKNMTFQEFFALCGEKAGFAAPQLLMDNDSLSRLLVRTGIGNSLRIECLEENIFRYTNRYFYYDPKKSRIGLHLSPAENIGDTIEKAYRWFEENV